MTIGVFDSGIGGKAVAEHIARELPDAEITVVNDTAHMPYGSKDMETIRQLTEQAILPLIRSNVDIIVLACNSATAAAIDYLRETYPEQRFIGLEPMVKPAVAATMSGKVIVCATPATLSSDRYTSLKAKYGHGTQFYEPDCSTWASMIERNEFTTMALKTALQPPLDSGADVIVLACTHYHWIRDEIQSLAKHATVIDPSKAIVKRIKQLLEQS